MRRGGRPSLVNYGSVGYYDHIIRDEAALDRIRGYIEANPLRWAFDRENPMACPAEQFREHTRTGVSPPTPARGGRIDTP
jgi:hypothetical protein